MMVEVKPRDYGNGREGGRVLPVIVMMGVTFMG